MTPKDIAELLNVPEWALHVHAPKRAWIRDHSVFYMRPEMPKHLQHVPYVRQDLYDKVLEENKQLKLGNLNSTTSGENGSEGMLRT